MSEPRALTKRDLVSAALTVVAALIVLEFLWQTRFLVLLTLLGVLLGIAATPAVDWMESRRVRRVVGHRSWCSGSLRCSWGYWRSRARRSSRSSRR